MRVDGGEGRITGKPPATEAPRRCALASRTKVSNKVVPVSSLITQIPNNVMFATHCRSNTMGEALAGEGITKSRLRIDASENHVGVKRFHTASRQM